MISKNVICSLHYDIGTTGHISQAKHMQAIAAAASACLSVASPKPLANSTLIHFRFTYINPAR